MLLTISAVGMASLSFPCSLARWLAGWSRSTQLHAKAPTEHKLHQAGEGPWVRVGRSPVALFAASFLRPNSQEYAWTAICITDFNKY